MASVQDIAEFAARLAAEEHTAFRSPYNIGQDVASLIKYARRIHRHAENQCNRDVTPLEEKRATADCVRLNGIASLYGAKLEFSGDPRGAVKLALASGRTNDFGGTGFCIPTR